jgi:hypothetical protein
MHDHRTIARRDHMALILHVLARRPEESAPAGEGQRRESLGLKWGPAFRAAPHRGARRPHFCPSRLLVLIPPQPKAKVDATFRAPKTVGVGDAWGWVENVA